jgi:hypothetical protein
VCCGCVPCVCKNIPYSIFLHTHFRKFGKCRLKPTFSETTSSILCRRDRPIWPKLSDTRHNGLTRHDMSATFPAKATIPALVLLDGLGTVVCGDGRRRLVNDPTGVHFPWTDSLSLPPDPRLGPHRAPPTGHTHPVSPLPHRTSWAPVPRRLRYHDGEINQPPHPSQLSHKEKARSLSPSPMGWIERMQPPENEKRPSGSRRRPRIGLRLPSWH